MRALGAALVGAGFRAVAVDMPAHGRAPGRRTSLAEWVRVLPALAEHVAGPGGVLHAVVGHSFGGTAVTLALEAGLRARGAVLLAAAQGPAHFLERTRQHVGLPAARAAGMERRLVARVGRELATFDAGRAATALELPALVVHDPADAEVPWRHAAAIAGAWRGSVLVAMPGVGHYAVVTSAPALARVVEFTRSLPVAACLNHGGHGGSGEEPLSALDPRPSAALIGCTRAAG
jgi:pimeloyl-ACP methyl ester carboxylesterase